MWALAVVAGVAAGIVGSIFLRLPEVRTDAWAVLTSIEIGVWTGLCVLGVSYIHRVLAEIVELRWATVVKTGALAFALLALTVVAFGPGDSGDVAFTVLQGVLAVVLISPWIIVMLGASWSKTASAAIRDRAEVVAIHRRGMWIATPILSVVLTLPVAATAALVYADGPLGDDGLPKHSGLQLEEGLSLLAFGVFLTLILVGALQFSLSALKHDSDMIRLEIADLAPAYRRHVDDAVVDRGLDIRTPLVWIATLPCIAGIAAAIVGWAAT